MRHRRNFDIVKPADKSAFDALREEFFYHRSLGPRPVAGGTLPLPIIVFLIAQSHQQIPRHVLEQVLMLLREMLTPGPSLS